METLLYVLPVLACPVAMGAMMWFMMRRPGHTGQAAPNNADLVGKQTELARLQAEIDYLRAAQHDQASSHPSRGRPTPRP